MRLLYVLASEFNCNNAQGKIGHLYDSGNVPSYTEVKPLEYLKWYIVVWQNELAFMQYTQNDMYDPPVYTYVEFAYKDGRKRMFNVNEIHVLDCE
jgi:hypothetical protein